MAGEDFVHVKQSAAGEKLAGDGKQVRISHARVHMTFKVGETQRVTKAYEWNHILRHKTDGGEAIFETVDAPVKTKSKDAQEG
jgi:hypothetical protein